MGIIFRERATTTIPYNGHHYNYGEQLLESYFDQLLIVAPRIWEPTVNKMK